MKLLKVTLTALALVVLGSAFWVMPASLAMPAQAATCTTTIPAGSDIQAAINAASPGDVICLAPGVYSPASKININKSVTLQGPQADVDPRPSAGTVRTPGDTSMEAIIDGSASSLSGIIVITADNVVLNGLEIRGGSGDLVDSETSSPTSGTVLQYNIIHDSSGDEGVQLRNVAGARIEYNYVYATTGDGINLCCGSSDGVIQFNEVYDISSPDAAVYVYGATSTTIQCNLVHQVNNNDGIKLGSKNGADASLVGGSVRYNVVHTTVQDGIAIYTSDTLVDGNEVFDSVSENGAIYLAHEISNVTIVDNNVHDNTLDPSKWGDPGAIMIGTAVDASTVTVNNNNITGNTVNGVTNKATALLNAEGNWWGAADGPAGAGPGGGDAVSTNVDFDPWLTAPAQPQGENPCIQAIGVINVEKYHDEDKDGERDEGEPGLEGWEFVL